MAPDRSAAERLALALADVAMVNLAFAAAYWLRYKAEVGGPIEWYNHVPYAEYVPWGVAASAILVIIFWFEGLYGRYRRTSLLDSFHSILSGTIVGIAVLTVLIFGLRPLAQSRLMLTYATVLIAAAVGGVREADLISWRRRLRRGEGVTRILIIGAGEVGRAVMRNVVADPDLGLEVVGFLDDNPLKRSEPIGRFMPLGGTDDLGRVLATCLVDGVIIAMPWQAREKIIRLVDECEAAGAKVRIVPDLFQMSLNRVDMGSLKGIPLIAVRAPTIRGWSYRLKRAIDVVLAIAALIAASPLMFLTAVAIRIDSPGPVLFSQPRVGRDGRLFTLHKFRSMRVGADALHDDLRNLNETTGPIFKIRDDPRLTRVGRILRRLSLDELPQLWNVLKGDMSLVGPRPPMPREVEQYKDWHRRRLDIAPGITGLWQVSGRSKLTFDEMVMLDLFYAENWTLGLDIKILLRTVPTVLMGVGAY